MRNALLVLTLTLTSLLTTSDGLKAKTIQLEPCEPEGFQERVKCGTFEVFEDRIAQKGRKIKLKVIVVPATGPNRLNDPLFYIPGGPGSSATEDAPDIASQFAKIREQRDLVFVDQRGTGESHPLNCRFYDPGDPQTVLGYFFPLEEVKQCRKELEAKANLTLYTTPVAMDDLNDVRAALGYREINIFGGSYGTRASLTYLKRHPKSVRTLLLQGVVPSGDYIPFDFARRTQRALEGVITECVTDGACKSAFPNLRAELKSVYERLLQGPVEVEINTNDLTGMRGPSNTTRAAKVNLTREVAAEAIRYMLYNAGGAARIPLVVHQAATGNFAPLAQTAYYFRHNLVASGSNGMYLTVTCAEDLPWFNRDEAEELASNTLLGAYRVRQQLEACELWPRAKVDPDYAAPSSAPVLMLTGEWDPVTPPSNAEHAARFLPNSLRVVVPQGGHGFGGLEGSQCLQELMNQFVAAGTTQNLHTECVKRIKRRAFVLK